jgi:hypothetical protein
MIPLRKTLFLSSFFSLSLALGVLLQPCSPLSFLASANERSITFAQGVNLALSRASSPWNDWQAIHRLSGAPSGGYVDTSFYYSQNDTALSYGADGSGYWCKQYVGENALDWGVFSWNILHPIRVSFSYSVNDAPSSPWRFDFYSEKNGGGFSGATIFEATPYEKKTVLVDVLSLGLSFVPRSLSLTYHLDSIYALTFYLNELVITYAC